MLSLPFAPHPSHPPPPPLKPPSLSPSPSARPPAVPGCGGCRVDPEPRRRGTVVGRPPPWLWGWGGPGQHVVKGGGGPAGSKPQGSRGLVVGGEGGPTQPGLAWRQPVPAPAGNTCRRMPQAARTECDREHGGETAGGRESVRQRCHRFFFVKQLETMHVPPTCAPRLDAAVRVCQRLLPAGLETEKKPPPWHILNQFCVRPPRKLGVAVCCIASDGFPCPTPPTCMHSCCWRSVCLLRRPWRGCWGCLAAVNPTCMFCLP